MKGRISLKEKIRQQSRQPHTQIADKQKRRTGWKTEAV
jgi:hypothetical protein